MIYSNAGIFSPALIGSVAPLSSNGQTAFGVATDVSWTTITTVPGYFDSLSIMLDIAVTTPDFVATLYINGSGTPLYVDIPNGSTGASDYDHSIPTNPGDEVNLVLSNTGDTGTFTFSIRFTET